MPKATRNQIKGANQKFRKSKPWSEFEEQVVGILRCFPGATVLSETLILGKKVDAICSLSGNLAPPFRIVVECKDWHKPIVRRDCAQIVSEYLPLIHKNEFDQFLLVTKNGIVPHAALLFDGKSAQHLTISELVNKILDPARLIQNMEDGFGNDNLDKFYVRPTAYIPEIKRISAKYDRVFNDFVDFALSLNYPGASELEWRYGATGDRIWRTAFLKRSYDELLKAWANVSSPNQKLTEDYHATELAEIIDLRQRTQILDLELEVLKWIADKDMEVGLAILGSYGTGKSSFAKRIAHVCARAYKKDATQRIPLLIELKEFGSHQEIQGLICHELVNRHKMVNGSFEIFQLMNKSGRFVVILDGFDEMKQGMTYDSLIYTFYQLANIFVPRTKILLCGRPTLFENEAERKRVLSGDFNLPTQAAARYVSLEIAPLDLASVKKVILKFAEIRFPSSYSRATEFVKEMEHEINTKENNHLLALVSRPVHLPMLVSILNKRNIDPSNLDRAWLYREFIDGIIEREMLKRRDDFGMLYSIQLRKDFARRVAVEMWRRGESRSIRNAELPPNLFEPLVTPGRPIEAVRRDLVAACFFETKLPDIIYIPHKSFLEYLVSEFVYLVLKSDSDLDEIINFRLSGEIIAFLFDLMKGDDLLSLLLKLLRSRKVGPSVFAVCIKMISEKKMSFEIGIEEAFLGLVDIASLMSVSMLIDLYASFYKSKINVSKRGHEIILKCLGHREDCIAVNALKLVFDIYGTRAKKYISKIDVYRLSYWVRSGWLNKTLDANPKLERIMKAYMISSILYIRLGSLNQSVEYQDALRA